MQNNQSENGYRFEPKPFERLIAILLGLAAVATAWSSYQGVRWSGRQDAKYNEGDALRVAASRMALVSDHERAVDLAMFAAWLQAYADDRHELSRFYRQRFRHEFAAPFEAWLALDPRSNATAPSSPFVMPSYRLTAVEDTERLSRAAASAVKEATEANDQSDAYQLLTVTFAAVLFLAGMVQPMHSPHVRLGIALLASVALIYGGVMLARYPVE